MKNKKFYNLIYSKKNNISSKYKNLFIGRWLNLELPSKNKKNIEFYNHEWLNKKKQIKDSEKVKKIYIEVLNNLISILNKYHSKNLNLRQWEIILFFFLYHYIPVAYDRWNMIQSIKKKYRLRPIELISYNIKSFECKHSVDVFDLIFSNEWNDWLISEIIKKQKLNYFVGKIFKKKKYIFKRKFQRKYSKKIFRFKNNNNKFFLTNLELPRIQKLKLNLKLNQLNFFYDQPSTNDVSSANERPDKIKILKSSNKFVNFITENIYRILPRNFIENFNEIEKKINDLNWPRNPKVIMTSYSHFTDEIFCIYTAKKIKEGAKFVILQHGHQGHHDFCGTYYEKRVCDKYLTWGNKSKDKKTIPLFVTTVTEKRIKKKNPSGILLKLTEFNLIPIKATHAPREIEGVTEYRDNLISFLSYIEKKLIKKTTVKSYDYINLNYVTKEIKKNFKDVKIKKFKKLTGRGYLEARDKNLIVETFNSTGFLELLTMNSPVILITTKNLFNIKKEYSIYYESLIKNKIIFFDSKEAAKYINFIYLNIEEWWFEKNRQKAIQFFCKNMCRFEKNQMKVLPKILKKISNESKNV